MKTQVVLNQVIKSSNIKKNQYQHLLLISTTEQIKFDVSEKKPFSSKLSVNLERLLV